MKGKKFKKKIRRVQKQLRVALDTEDVRYMWLLRINEILHTNLARAPTEDELFQAALEAHRSQS